MPIASQTQRLGEAEKIWKVHANALQGILLHLQQRNASGSD